MNNMDASITEHIPRLRRYARALTGDRIAADDLVQDTLERAWGKLHMWRSGSDMRAWMFSIMHNIFISLVRKHQLDTVAIGDDALAVATRATQEDNLQMRDLASAIAQLPSEYREVILLIGLEQMSYEEVAQVLGIPLGTVMSRLSRGRERLRKLMAGESAPVLRRVK
jgi:RNA polymerase sigma-70 factor (ECF subfamily)